MASARRRESPCFEVTDTSTTRIAGSALLPGSASRDPNPQIARLCSQFIAANRTTLSHIDAEIDQQYDGSRVELVVRTHTKVGAVSLISPTTGRHDYGLVVKPRFEWSGLGPMLSDMGWRVIPSPLALPLLPRSDRKIPPWVLSTIVLFRLEALLDRLERRFEVVDELRTAPRGSVNWTAYATRYISRAQFLNVPCRFPDLRDDRALKAAIRFTLQKQLQGLDGQRAAGVFVVRLLELCQSLLERVRDTPPRQPGPRELDAWFRGPLRTDTFRDGLQAIEWTVDDRGLAGLSDLQGLPWAMSMDSFFEAWSEAVLVEVARKIGGTLRSGRKRETLAPLSWEPPYLGSQKYLLPDLMLERGDTTIIVDAKYKEHWEEMQDRPWGQLEDELRERHRADLLQVLAYGNLTTSPRILLCLAYPCSKDTWTSVKERGRLFHRASLRAGDRRIDLRLTAFPMGVPITEVADVVAKEIVS
ncbi:MAG: hypothetical protein M3P30_02365 [Chloroflexota bacterium]|nr:hypothetical protein [Chloroflexota bacterium]